MVSFADFSGEGDEDIEYTILLGMQSGSAPSLAGMAESAQQSVGRKIVQRTQLSRDQIIVFDESIVAREVGNGSLWMFVIKLHSTELLNSEVRNIADKLEDGLSEIGFTVMDRHIVTNDYFVDSDVTVVDS